MTVQRTDEESSPAPIIPESTIPVIQEFQGKATILLNPGGKWPFSLGLAKCKMVLNNISFIQQFVDSGGTSVE